MHISEGVLTAPVLIAGGALTVAGTWIGLKAIDYERIMVSAILTSTFFVASLIHVPVGPASAHMVLNGLLGVILGWGAFPAILIGLLLQSVFFQFGGITVLGINTFNMAGAAVISFYLIRPWLIKEKTRALAAFAGGFAALFLASVFMALSLIISDTGFLRAAQITILAQLPVMVIEGFVTMFAVSFLAKVQPEILGSPEK